MKLVISLVSGLLFGLGLLLSGLSDPEKVIGFLDVAGAWNPQLAFVMLGAVSLSFVAFRHVTGRERSMLGEPVQLPTSQALDARLLLGAALFGIGWGLAGYCPGPALASLATMAPEPLIFVLSMLLGMALFEVIEHARKG